MAPKIVDFNEGWGEMERAFTKLKTLLGGSTETLFSGEEYMKLYTTIYDMCTQKPPFDFSMRLYDKYKETLNDYHKFVVLPSVIGKHDEFMLRELFQRWSQHKVLVRWLSHFLHHIDRFLPARCLPTLKVAGLTSFRDMVYMEARANVTEAVIALIHQERESEQIDRSLLKNIVGIFVDIDMGKMECYEKHFEVHMLNSTADYYKSKSAIWIQSNSRSDYMQKAEECLRRERNIVSQYLHSSTEQKLIEKVHHELLVNHANYLLEKEYCCDLIRNDEVDDLSRIFRLYEKIPGVLDELLIPVADVFKQVITYEGTALVTLAEEEDATNQKTRTGGSGFQDQDQGLVRKFIDLHDKYMTYIDICFMNHSPFFKALREAFEVFSNKTVAGSSIAELLASFCDHILKKGGSEKLSDEVVEEILEKAVQMLAYSSDKDHFAEFFCRKLSLRLLFNTSAQDKHENYILKRLQQEYGNLFTAKMEKMVNDITLSKANQMKFQRYLTENSHVDHGIDLKVTLLTTGSWPNFKHLDLTLPSEMAAALILFNTVDKLSYSEISSQLNLPEEDLNRLLHSLSCGKHKIIVKEPNSPTISSNDSFEFNSKFTSKRDTIKLVLPPVYERKTVTEDVDRDRRYAMDLAIVRIMKSRKVLGLQQLFAECIKQLIPIFKPDIRLIKKRIDDLISREYLERDKDDSNTFRYLPEAAD